ncbi:MAG: glycosyltransferase family 4 protein [Planctomycetes bacterium]|nr:glycosyltransferase family 4 protein [Planctomycetota bacterium]
MSQRLISAGHRVTLVCGMSERAGHQTKSKDRVTEFDADGIRVLCVREFYASRMGFARRILAFWNFARTARKLVSRLDADLVFATSTPLTVGLPGMRAAKRLGVPFVFEVRDLWPEIPIAMDVVKNPLLIWYLRRMERKIYHAADHIFALAPGIQQGICRTGYPADRVSMIPNSADLSLFRSDGGASLDDRYGTPDELKLVFTGAHGKANGLDAVLDAARCLKRRGVRNVRFVFIGSGGIKPRLMARSQDDGTNEMISWVDPLPKRELAAILPSMAVGMMILKNVPSFYYGTSPNKFFDYLSCGLPVLNNYPGWLADMIGEHRCGVVVPPDDPEAFADAVVYLSEHREELPDMGRRARQLAEESFSRDLMGERFVNTLERVHGEQAPSA